MGLDNFNFNKLLDPRIIMALFLIGCVLAISTLIPWWFWTIIVVLGIIYIVVPVDLIPESLLGIYGILDDALVFGITLFSAILAILQPFAGSYIFFIGIVFVAVSVMLLVLLASVVKKRGG